MITKIALAVILLALSGCAQTDDLVKLAIKDVKSAHASAEAWGDPLAEKCWGFLVSKIPDAKPTEVIGIATAYQKARNVRRAIQLKDTDAFKLACGPMIVESRSFIRGLITRF